MAKTTGFVTVLWFSFWALVPQSVIAQIAPSNQQTQHPPPQSETPPRKATLSSEPENGSPDTIAATDEPSRVVQIGGRVNLGITETVDSIILFMGDAKIHGRVNGDIFVLSGDVEIKESAQVLGKVTVVLGEILGMNYLREGASKTAGLYQEINGWALVPATVSLMMEGVPQGVWGTRKHAWFGWKKLMTFITLTLIHMLLAAVFPQQISDMAYTISHRPIGSTLLGLVVLIIIPYLSMLLILSLVGIPLMLLFSAILLLMAIYGKTAIFFSIGNTIFPHQSNVVAAVVGYWIYRMATTIPYLGVLTFVIACTIGIGVSMWQKGT